MRMIVVREMKYQTVVITSTSIVDLGDTISQILVLALLPTKEIFDRWPRMIRRWKSAV